MRISQGRNSPPSSMTPSRLTCVMDGFVCTRPLTRCTGSSSLMVGWQLSTLSGEEWVDGLGSEHTDPFGLTGAKKRSMAVRVSTVNFRLAYVEKRHSTMQGDCKRKHYFHYVALTNVHVVLTFIDISYLTPFRPYRSVCLDP